MMKTKIKKGVMLIAIAIIACLTFGLIACSEPEPSAPVLAGISITNKTELTADWRVGDADRTMTVSLSPESFTANNTEITVTSSGAAITVDGTDKFKLHAAAEGKATVTVTAGEFSDSVEITVSRAVPPLSGIAVNKTELEAEWYIGEADRTVRVTYDPSSDYNAGNTPATVTSSKPDIVKVEGMNLKAVGAGAAKITVTAGGKTATADITVKPVLESITLGVKSHENMTVGDAEREVTATVLPASITGAIIEFASDNDAVAVVEKDATSGKFMLKAKAKGTAKITATVHTANAKEGEKTAEFEVTVADVGVSFADSEKLTLAVDEKHTRTASSPKSVTYSVKDGSTDVITVNATTGEVTAVAAGTRTVVATVQGGATAEYEVEVAALTLTAAAPANALTWGDDYTFVPTLKLGEQTVSGEFDYQVSYSGDIITVDANDKLKITAAKAGTASIKITANYHDVDVESANISVTVKDKVEVAFVFAPGVEKAITVSPDHIYDDDIAATASAPSVTVYVNEQATDSEELRYSVPDDNGFATVNASTGAVTAVAVGETTLTAVCSHGGDAYSDTCAVKVVPQVRELVINNYEDKGGRGISASNGSGMFAFSCTGYDGEWEIDGRTSRGANGFAKYTPKDSFASWSEENSVFRVDIKLRKTVAELEKYFADGYRQLVVPVYTKIKDGTDDKGKSRFVLGYERSRLTWGANNEGIASDSFVARLADEKWSYITYDLAFVIKVAKQQTENDPNVDPYLIFNFQFGQRGNNEANACSPADIVFDALYLKRGEVFDFFGADDVTNSAFDSDNSRNRYAGCSSNVTTSYVYDGEMRSGMGVVKHTIQNGNTNKILKRGYQSQRTTDYAPYFEKLQSAGYTHIRYNMFVKAETTATSCTVNNYISESGKGSVSKSVSINSWQYVDVPIATVISTMKGSGQVVLYGFDFTFGSDVTDLISFDVFMGEIVAVKQL